MVTRADWDGFNHARHGASPDLVVALCLLHLGCSKSTSVELVSGSGSSAGGYGPIKEGAPRFSTV
jgi:hypothetical protein